MLVRLLYASRAAESVNADALAAIVKARRSATTALGVTGVLCSLRQRARLPAGARRRPRCRSARSTTGSPQDPRHRDVVLLSYEEIGERSFLELVDGPGER